MHFANLITRFGWGGMWGRTQVHDELMRRSKELLWMNRKGKRKMSRKYFWEELENANNNGEEDYRGGNPNLEMWEGGGRTFGGITTDTNGTDRGGTEAKKWIGHKCMRGWMDKRKYILGVKVEREW